MSDPFDISVTGLLAFQRSLTTVSHNISNANTDGYTRQRVELFARPPQKLSNGFIGQGVFVSNIDRVEDLFLNSQIQFNTSESHRLGEYLRHAEQIDNLLAEGQASLSPALQGFFNGVEEVVNNSASASTRTVMMSSADSLVQRFHFLGAQLDSKNATLNKRLDDLVVEVNALAGNLAEVNNAIIIAKGQKAGKDPNDLLDQRQQLINQLAERVAVSTTEESNGALNVFIGKGQTLVLGNQYRTLTTLQDPENFSNLQVAYQTGSGSQIISNQLTGGEIGGLLDFRNTILTSVRNEIGRIGTVLAQTFNTQHRNGMDLNGALGTDFFTVPSPIAITSTANTGTATATASITDVTALKASDYRLFYDGSNYTLTRLSDNNIVTGAGPFSVDGLNITVSAGANAGDTFLIRPVYYAASTLALATTDIREIAAAIPVRSSSSISNIGNAIISAAEVTNISNADLLDTVEIIFNNPPTTFNINNITDSVTIASNVTYTSANTISFNGVQVAISGAPNAGDRFRIERNSNGISDNRNALALRNLQNQNFVEGAASYMETYGSMIASVGTTTNQFKINSEAQDKLLLEAKTARESVSGVNLDEEAANMLRFQRAYQAAAQMIAVADVVFESLLNAVRR